MDKSEDKDFFLDQIVAVINESFEPVNNLREIEEMITTDDLIQAVQLFYPSENFEVALFVKLLNTVGFKFTTTHSGALQFVWLMKRR